MVAPPRPTPPRPHNPTTLQPQNPHVLTVIKGRAEEVRYPPTFHIVFIQPSAQHVDAINARLKADGFAVPPPSQQHGSWTFYFQAPGRFVIEVLS